MTFDGCFKAASYATVACGAAALALAGGFGAGLGLAFVAVLAASWVFEGRRWQMPERAGLVVVLVALPLFYLDWRFQTTGETGAAEVNAGVSALVHLTLFLSAVKLFQVKSDRDWLFLYLVSFFEVLLAAGLSVSPLFLAALALYLFCALLAIVCFELRRAGRSVPRRADARTRITYDSPRRQRRAAPGARELRRLPLAALLLLALVFALALPIFFITPRFGARPAAFASGGATGFVGFSDRVSLGDIGRLQRSDRLVMRVKVEGEGALRPGGLRWRGVSLDNFDGRTWRRSSNESLIVSGGERDFFQLGTTEDAARLTTQTFFVEPLDTPTLFAAARAVAVQGPLDFVRRYADGGVLTTSPHPRERITYRVYSDTVEPSADDLRADRRRYPRERTPNLQAPIETYLQLPASEDERVAALARSVVVQSGARNRYDAARAIEAHLNSNQFGGDYGYSLDMRARGSDPLADFLFNVRAGHCEYFASAMAVMLRTQGVAARVVNGFQAGEYNASAGAYVVRQYDAHSWVEVYFPETDAWVAFDPTPVEGRPGARNSSGIAASLRRYADALELLWIQYVVTYDKQEQRSIASSFGNAFASLSKAFAQALGSVGAGLSSLVAGGAGETAGASFARVLTLLAALVALLLAALYARRLLRKRGRARGPAAKSAEGSVVEFYERMTRALEARGLRRAPDQTPLEFAGATNFPEALAVTNAYHRVRYGGRPLTRAEAAEVENCLRKMEEDGLLVNGK